MGAALREEAVGSAEYLTDPDALMDGLRLAGVGIWRWRVDSEMLLWTDNLEEVHALPAGSFDGTLDSFRNDIHPEDMQAVWTAISNSVTSGDPYRVVYRTRQRAGVEPLWIEAAGGLARGADGLTYLTGACLDVSARIRGEVELNRRLSQQRAIERFGSFALGEEDFQLIMERAVDIAAEVLDVPLAKVLKFTDTADSLLLAAGLGWQDGLVGQGRVGIEQESQAGFTLINLAPVIVEDLATEARFSGPQLLRDHGVVSGISVVIPGDERRPFGVFGVHDRRRRAFSAADAEFLTSMANIVASSARHKAAADHRMLLVREMAHRAGNMLQLVSTIANQTFGGERPREQALHAFSERLASLARANYQIARGGWTATRFMLVAEETLQPFRDRMVVTGRDILLPPELCFDLGLVLHELATNSVKYGALHEGGERAELNWTVATEADGEVFRLDWFDPVRHGQEPSEGEGFGSRLMRALIERKWNGAISVDASCSYRFSLSLPLPDAA